MGDSPLEHAKFVRELIGDEAHDELILAGNQVKKFLAGEKDAMLKHYKSELKHVEKSRSEGIVGLITCLDWETNARESWLLNENVGVDKEKPK